MNNPIAARFCRNVHKLRVRQGLSVPEMAKFLGLTEDLLILLESGVLTEQMDVSIIFQIRKHFDIRLNQLFSQDIP